MGQLNVANLQGTSNSGFKITLTRESTLAHEGDVRFLTSQSYQDLPVYGSKNFLAHKFFPLDLFTANPNDANNVGWNSGVRCTLTRDTGTAGPTGIGGVPLKMVTSGNDSYTNTYNSTAYNVCSASQGQVWTFSVYAKASGTQSNCELYLFEAPDSGGYTVAHNTAITIPTTWTRFSITRTISSASTTKLQVRVGGPDSGHNGGSIWWVGAQLERAGSVSTFADGGSDTAKEDSAHQNGSVQYNAETENLRLYKENQWVNTAGTSNTAGAVGTIGTGGGFSVAEGAINTNHQAVTGTENPILFEGLRYNDGTTGDETLGSTPNTRSFLEYVSSTSSNDFAFHTGHSSPGNVAWPQYFAVKVTEWDFGQVLNRIRWYKHGNMVGNVNVWGSNQDVHRGNFTQTANLWTFLARLHFGGSGSGSEGGQRSESFSNSVGYRWYMLEMVDINSSALAYPSVGTQGGWAAYPLTFDKT